MTSFLQGLLLGIVQGITEWLPINSEGINTLIFTNLLHMPFRESVRLAIWLHTGTLMAAAVYLRRDIATLIRHLPQYLRELRTDKDNVTERSALITCLVISTLLGVVIGLLVFRLDVVWVQPSAALVTPAIGVFLIITGLVQKYALKATGTKKSVSVVDAILLGVVQGLAVFPGLSRSGLTVSALLFRGYDAAYAVKLSFLVSIPLVLTAEIGLALMRGARYDLVSVTAIVMAFLFGLLTINALIKIATRVHFWKFCIFLGAVSILSLLVDRL